MTTAHTTRWIGLVAGVAVFVTGCGGPGGPPDDGPPGPRLPPAGKAAGVTLPLDAYGISADDQERADRAQVATELGCLRRFGLDWTGPPEDDLLVGRALIATRLVERFGLVDEEQANRYGYHPPPWSPLAPRPAEQPDGTGHARDAPPAKVAEVLFGTTAEVGGQPVPDGGCRGEAARRLAAGAAARSAGALVTRLEAEGAQRTATDARWVSLSAAWAACMSRAGHTFRSPTEAAWDPRWRRATEPDPVEISVARADVRCKEEVGYLATLAEVTTEHQRALIAEHADVLAEIRRQNVVRIANIGAVLGECPSRARKEVCPTHTRVTTSQTG